MTETTTLTELTTEQITANHQEPGQIDSSPGPLELEFYSKNHCVQCDTARRALASQGLILDQEPLPCVRIMPKLDEDEQALSMVRSRRHAAAPVMIITQTVDGESLVRDEWAGFRPDKIRQWAPVLLNQGLESSNTDDQN